MGKVFVVECLIVSLGVVALLLSTRSHGSPTSGSCRNRCGYASNSNTQQLCLCDIDCKIREDCCGDYEEVCFSCKNRCSDPMKPGAPCQCHSQCGEEKSCCSDRKAECEGGHINNTVTDEDLLNISQELSDLEQDNMAKYLQLDIQCFTNSNETSDCANRPLFAEVDHAVSHLKHVQLFLAMKNNYVREVSVEEVTTAEEEDEEDAFLDAAIATPMMKRLEQFLQEKGLLKDTLKSALAEMWFTSYSRDGVVLGSSGFEHVFFGEYNGDMVGGFHNWIVFYLEELGSHLNYQGCIELTRLKHSGWVFTSRFTWEDRAKPIGGGLIGTSPHYELGVYSLCFLARPNSLCTVKIDGVLYDIQTYNEDGKRVVATAYPIVNKK